MKKYRNKKCKIGGYSYDSIGEAKRHQQLQIMERAGLIRDLKFQTKITLLESFKYNSKCIRGITYKPDFEYFEKNKNGDWVRVIEDFKGFRNQVYKIKKKFVLNSIKDDLNTIFRESDQTFLC